MTNKSDLKKHLKGPSASADLISRIMSDAEETLARQTWQIVLWPFGPVWKPAMVLAGAAMMGIWFGLYDLPEAGYTITDEIETMMVG